MIEIREEQPPNTPLKPQLSMLVMLLGIVIDFKLLQQLNGQSAILVTSYVYCSYWTSLGMTTSDTFFIYTLASSTPQPTLAARYHKSPTPNPLLGRISRLIVSLIILVFLTRWRNLTNTYLILPMGLLLIKLMYCRILCYYCQQTILLVG